MTDKIINGCGYFAMFFCFACQGIFTQIDIRGQAPVVVVPSPGVELDQGDVTLLWEGMDGADSYRVQVVSPSFGSAEQLQADCLCDSTHFRLHLQPASYQWRVRGENPAYCSVWTYGTFTVKPVDAGQ